MRNLAAARRLSPTALRLYATKAKKPSTRRPPLIHIENATFYRNHPDSHTPSDDSTANAPLYPNLSFTLPSESEPHQHWAILSSSSVNRTAFLQILQGQYLSLPPHARSYPYLQGRNPRHAIQYVGFDAERGGLPGGASTKGAYMSARYESTREATDWSLRDYLLGNTELNADDQLQAAKPSVGLVDRVVQDLHLETLQHVPVSHLSNGQTRRARIAKALLARPELLLLDGTFMGLDPHTMRYLSDLLHRLAESRFPRVLLSLRPQDYTPSWITHFAVVGDTPVVRAMGSRRDIYNFLRDHYERVSDTDVEFRTAYYKLADKGPEATKANKQRGPTTGDTRKYSVDSVDKEMNDLLALFDIARKMEAKGDLDDLCSDPVKAKDMRNKLKRPKKSERVMLSRDGLTFGNDEDVPDLQIPIGEPVVQMEGVQIKYNDSEVPVLGACEGGLWWEVRRGQRWGIFGPNGSGKTTLLSLITSDHPQTYSAPVKLFGRSRLPTPGTPGMSIFEIQSRMGHSSPEVHTYFPKHLTVRRVLESAWADTPLSKPRLTHEADERINACLRWFRGELCPALGDTLDQRGEAFRYARDSKATTRESLFWDITATTLKDEAVLLHSALDWADQTRFGELPFSGQRVALFLRAIIKAPDLVVLDEAFSGMDEFARDKCMLFLHHGEAMMLRHSRIDLPRLRPWGAVPKPSAIAEVGRVRMPGLAAHQALVVVAHARDDVPNSVRDYINLPEAGSGARPRIGRLSGPLGGDWRRWGEVWGIESKKGRARHHPDPDEERRYDAVMGSGSPIEMYNKSLNVLKGMMGSSGVGQAAVVRGENKRRQNALLEARERGDEVAVRELEAKMESVEAEAKTAAAEAKKDAEKEKKRSGKKPGRKPKKKIDEDEAEKKEE